MFFSSAVLWLLCFCSLCDAAQDATAQSDAAQNKTFTFDQVDLVMSSFLDIVQNGTLYATLDSGDSSSAFGCKLSV